LTFFRFRRKAFLLVGGEKEMEKNKKYAKSILAVLIFAVIVFVLGLVYNKYKPQTQEGSKEISVMIVVPEEETKEVAIKTDAEYLRQALDEKKLIEGSDSAYGYYITAVEGRTADGTKEEWWCITKDGENVNTGIDSTPIADGDKFELTFMIGY
jgi:hypothetical protein